MHIAVQKDDIPSFQMFTKTFGKEWNFLKNYSRITSFHEQKSSNISMDIFFKRIKEILLEENQIHIYCYL